MEFLSIILSPIMVGMRFFLDTAYAVTGDFGIAIMLLSATVRLLTAPISRLASGSQKRTRRVQAEMAPALAAIRAESKGRERFERTDEVYRRHGYHPIHSAASTLPLFLQIPFLLSALLLLSHHEPLAGERFLFIPDLLRPDGLFPGPGFTINILPLLVTVIALVESRIRSDSSAADRRNFLLIAVIIALLIYAAPAAVCLYWLTSNLLSLGKAAIRLGPQTAPDAR